MAYALHQAHASPTVGKLLLSLETDQEAYGSPSNELKDFLFGGETLKGLYRDNFGACVGRWKPLEALGGIMTQLQPLHDSYACATRTKACSHTT